jgi:hypothetical protein
VSDHDLDLNQRLPDTHSCRFSSCLRVCAYCWGQNPGLAHARQAFYNRAIILAPLSTFLQTDICNPFDKFYLETLNKMLVPKKNCIQSNGTILQKKNFLNKYWTFIILWTLSMTTLWKLFSYYIRACILNDLDFTSWPRKPKIFSTWSFTWSLTTLS